jgi:hypothetical protein
LIAWVEALENQYPDESPHEILVRLRDQVKKAGRSSKSGGSGGGSRANGIFGSGPWGSGSGSTCSPQNGTKLGQPYWSYIFAAEHGWIDLGHFLEAARYGAYIDDWLVEALGEGVEWHQYYLGSRNEPGTRSSAFTKEDLTSNYEGIHFGDGMRNDVPLSLQLREFFEAAGATHPTDAPDWWSLPQNEEAWETECWRRIDLEEREQGGFSIWWEEYKRWWQW